ncbi:hypothetical protein [Sphingopyxis sp. 550A]
MGIAVFFCEQTGKKSYHRGFRCDACDHRHDEPCSEADHDAYSNDGERPERECVCGQKVRVNSWGSDTEMRRVDTGELFKSHRDLPPGAIYEAIPYYDGEPNNWRQSKRSGGREYFINRPGVDGRILVCVCPDGHAWTIDARASNCTMKDDDEHWCWCRHGKPEDGTLHVDKNGLTCKAGAGSIDTGKWHGFLHNGELKQC